MLITLNNCSSISATPPVDDRVVIKYVEVNRTIPFELLTPTDAPSLSLLEDVELCRGKDAALKYLKDLYDAYYINREKLFAIKLHVGGSNE